MTGDLLRVAAPAAAHAGGLVLAAWPGVADRGWVLDPEEPLQVVAGGEDRSLEAEDDIGKAMTVAARSRPDASAAAMPAGQIGRGARDQGVETRNMVVIRE